MIPAEVLTADSLTVFGALFAALAGGVTMLFAAWKMITRYEDRTTKALADLDKTNRAEHAELLRAVHAISERIATVEGKLDVLIANAKP